MEEPELRVGGWEKERSRRSFGRIFNLILIIAIAFAIAGPSLVKYNPAYVPSDSLYLANGMWNGPFEVDYSKEFVGHVKVSSVTYETTLDRSGIVRIISLSSLIDLKDVELQNRIVGTVEQEAHKEGLTLTKGVIRPLEGIDIPTDSQLINIYEWEGRPYHSGNYNTFFGQEDSDMENSFTVRAIVWNEADAYVLEEIGDFYQQYQTVVCIIFGANQEVINQAIDLIEDVA